MRRIIVAGTSSHSGKTTITCALLASLKKRGLHPIAYKAGPDYIDREYLRMAGNCEAYNLDTWLMSEERMLHLFAETSRGRDIAVIEGVMGLYDGGINSTATIAKLLDAPVLLVIDARSTGESAAAVALGFREYDRDVDIAGVILNNISSDYHAEIITGALESAGITCFGAMRRDEGFVIPERHLGLLQAVENSGFDTGRLAAMFEACVDVDGILRLADDVRDIRPCSEKFPKALCNVRVGVASDEAFSFVYPESLMVLAEMGAEIIPFSPLHDTVLPDADGYIFCGGYPEIFAEGLAANTPMLASVREVAMKKPVIAECGGMMYLCRTLRDSDGRSCDMAGVLPSNAYMSGRAVMGYRTGVALRDNILCLKGESLRAHEYHYGRIEPDFVRESGAFEVTRRDGSGLHYDGYSRGNVLASWLHVNLWGCPDVALRFADVLTSSWD